jgi:tetratricopeptide (TPR) repeat protein
MMSLLDFKLIVRTCNSLISVLLACSSFCLTLGWGNSSQVVRAQALVPHTLQLDFDDLQKKGQSLAQEAVQLAQFQQFQLALSRAKLATQLAPNNAEIWAVLGSLYLQNEKLDEGIAALQQAKSLEPDNAAVLFILGSAYFQQSKPALAIESLQAGLKLKPNSPNALFDLGNAYYVTQQYSQAIAQYEKAVAQETKFWPAVNNIGLIEYERGDIESAIKKWQAASALDEKAAEPRLALAIALYLKGDREKALNLGESALGIDNRYGDLKFLKDNLWGDKLLKDAETFLGLPRIQSKIAQEKSNSQSSSQ